MMRTSHRQGDDHQARDGGERHGAHHLSAPLRHFPGALSCLLGPLGRLQDPLGIVERRLNVRNLCFGILDRFEIHEFSDSVDNFQRGTLGSCAPNTAHALGSAKTPTPSVDVIVTGRVPRRRSNPPSTNGTRGDDTWMIHPMKSAPTGVLPNHAIWWSANPNRTIERNVVWKFSATVPTTVITISVRRTSGWPLTYANPSRNFPRSSR
jgi:hypothetical protein